MPRDYFAKWMRSPQFQQERYRQSPGGQFEIKVEKIIAKIIKKIIIWKK